MALDIDALLKSLGDDAPSGEDLEYDPAFIDLELAAMPKEEQQVGDSIIAAEDPDFKEVVKHAVAVLQRAHDLRAAVFYAHAALRLEGLKGFEQALVYIRRCCEEFWDTCHPQLDADDNNDPTMRMNAIAGLAGHDTVLRALRMAPLTNSRAMGRFSLRDIQIARGEMPPGKDDDPVETSVISAAFQDTKREDLIALNESIKSCRQTLKDFEKVLDDKVGSFGPDLSNLSRTLYDMEHVFKTFAEDLIAEEEVEEDAGGEGEEAGEAGEGGGDAAGGDGAAAPAGSGAPRGGPRGVGTIQSRKDVVTAVDKIIEYYQKHEPTSPVPLLLLRAKRLVNSDFVTIMKDLAPEGLEKVNLIAGIESEGGYE
ncbi:type VI secretion system protein TssA [Paralimibaculum aggregatum]|uniref:Type VI secretion system protein TssA n=1 Tax=Paralimibaculum aggregatum TaxID=3036245 RepID=A0ABQ6LE27_9RHOB|nr:type VI secretion system protein TssA [Limibaculum sp. NKW23]GMG81615.1 type VI secretion system protein TssA [Limibaculum sp. NKW23]